MVSIFVKSSFGAAQAVLSRCLPNHLADDIILTLEDHFETAPSAGRRVCFQHFQIVALAFSALFFYATGCAYDWTVSNSERAITIFLLVVMLVGALLSFLGFGGAWLLDVGFAYSSLFAIRMAKLVYRDRESLPYYRLIINSRASRQ